MLIILFFYYLIIYLSFIKIFNYINSLNLIIKVINEDKIRDKALILIGFAGGFRRSELVNIENEDVEFVEEGVKILIKRSKTDQSGAQGSLRSFV